MKSLWTSLLAAISLSLAACGDKKNAESLARIEAVISKNTDKTQRIIVLPQTQSHTLTIVSTMADGSFVKQAVVLTVNEDWTISGNRIYSSWDSHAIAQHNDAQWILAETALNLEKNLPSTSPESNTGIDKK